MTQDEIKATRPKPIVRGKNGGKRPNGRLKKEQVEQMVETMDRIMPLDDVWSVLAEKVNKGDTLALKIWLSYRLGNPRTVVEQTNLNINAGEIAPDKIKLFNKELENKY